MKDFDGSELRKDITLYFKDTSIDSPKLMVQESKAHPDEVALILQVVPTFDPQPQGELKVVFDTPPPEQEEFVPGNTCFVFIIDRSGSMDGPRIEMAKEALRLFLQSLPVGSKFDVISFGSKKNLKVHSQGGGFPYTDSNLTTMKSIIDAMEADMGGTEIFEPMDYAFKNPNYRSEGY